MRVRSRRCRRLLLLLVPLLLVPLLVQLVLVLEHSRSQHCCLLVVVLRVHLAAEAQAPPTTPSAADAKGESSAGPHKCSQHLSGAGAAATLPAHQHLPGAAAMLPPLWIPFYRAHLSVRGMQPSQQGTHQTRAILMYSLRRQCNNSCLRSKHVKKTINDQVQHFGHGSRTRRLKGGLKATSPWFSPEQIFRDVPCKPQVLAHRVYMCVPEYICPAIGLPDCPLCGDNKEVRVP